MSTESDWFIAELQALWVLVKAAAEDGAGCLGEFGGDEPRMLRQIQQLDEMIQDLG